MLPKFEGFPKIARLRRNCIITEKIDGTNASVLISDDLSPFKVEAGAVSYDVPFLCASRSRWIFPQADNHGFCNWAYENRDALLKLGPGQHFGEWWGGSIQKRYGVPGKTFSLFNVSRWTAEAIAEIGHPQLKAVPTLYAGPFTDSAVTDTLTDLTVMGSKAVPGCMRPEGIVIFHESARALFKLTLDGDGHKGER